MSSTSTDKNQDYLGILKNNSKRYDRIMFLKRLFDAENYELRIAGGAIRDILRNKEPHDIDFATNARPEATFKILSSREDVLRVITTTAGQRHGTVAAKFKETDSLSTPKKQKLEEPNLAPIYDDESPFEITTLRRDKITDGRHAEVEFIDDWKTDAERRDLTINAMFLTLDGQLIDFYDGKRDLENGIVRFVGDQRSRIREDYLRILRFFRFWSRYGLQQPQNEVLQAIKENLEGLNGISGERLWQETKKILSSNSCCEVVRLMLTTGLAKYLGFTSFSHICDPDGLDVVIKELTKTQANLERYIEMNQQATDKKFLELLPVIRFASIIPTLEDFDGLYKRLKFSNLERDLMMHILSNKEDDIDMKVLKGTLATCHRPEIEILRLRIKAFLIYKGANQQMITEISSWDVPRFPISGHHITTELRSRKMPLKYVRDIMDVLKEEWVQSDYQLNEEQLISMMNPTIDALKKQEV